MGYRNHLTKPQTDSHAAIPVCISDPTVLSTAFDFNYAAGAVVIKRHDLAVHDYNCILASLVGTSVTTCGSIMGSITTPSPDAQTQAIRNAYHDAGIHPHHADFVELHGTGTVVGDRIETNAAGAVFAEGRGGREIIIGSVKSNVGHGETG